MNNLTLEECREKLGKLEALGHPDLIAWELESQGVQGVRRSSAFCAIAAYLGNDIETMQPFKTPVSVGLGRYGVRGDNGHVSDYLPGPVSAFIDRFDRGDYPAITWSDR